MKSRQSHRRKINRKKTRSFFNRWQSKIPKRLTPENVRRAIDSATETDTLCPELAIVPMSPDTQPDFDINEITRLSSLPYWQLTGWPNNERDDDTPQ